jgi:hypothetical protein
MVSVREATDKPVLPNLFTKILLQKFGVSDADADILRLMFALR